MRYWALWYWRTRNHCRIKMIKAPTAEAAIKKARVKDIADLQEIDEAEYNANQQWHLAR